uniref:Uncharacterized protein n=1 Tax=Globodera rostochiensis TaxID=31243 RepID=A0A914HJN3_GLORO
MALQLLGHTVSSVARLSVPHLQLTVTSSAVIRLVLSFLPNIVIAINAPVLYKMNSEYRQAFQNVFKFLRSSSTYVTTISQQKRWAHRIHRSVSEHQKL